jgi:hypothetical protein
LKHVQPQPQRQRKHKNNPIPIVSVLPQSHMIFNREMDMTSKETVSNCLPKRKIVLKRTLLTDSHQTPTTSPPIQSNKSTSPNDDFNEEIKKFKLN